MPVMKATQTDPVCRRALLLDGAGDGDATGPRVRAAVSAALEAAGWEPDAVTLREQRIGACAGDFGCWVRHPGTCMTADDNRTIAAAMVRSDLVVYLGPVTFGGWSPASKRMIDHQIQNIAPGFTRSDGETHHQKRYAHYPDLLAVGWQDAPDPAAASVFMNLAARNAINFHAAASAAGIIDASATDDAIRVAVDGLVRSLARREQLRAVKLPPFEPVSGPAPKRALLLVGSPRTRTSTSNALGAHLLGRLAVRGIETGTVHLHPIARSAPRIKALLDAVDAADLVVLAFPLYVDSLPAPVVDVLTAIAAHRAGSPATPRQRFAAIANCGFPEATQNATALAICATFARQAGFGWAGDLALGGGEGLVHGVELARLGGRARHAVAALDLAGDALSAGDPIPEAAHDLLARPAIPGWLYRGVGGLGWRLQARRFGMASSLGRRPYAP